MTDAPLTILYRGPLASCNYGCEYCPFAKRVDSRDQLADDARALARFVSWVIGRDRPAQVLFTPWGEALIRSPYRRALIELTNAAGIQRAAIQTNLSCDLAWTRECQSERLGIWATYHPDWIDLERFATKVRTLHERGVQVSAGVVGVREHFAAIEALRSRLPPDLYLWINAYKREPAYYSPDELTWLQTIDPLFPVNNQYHPSRGHACRAGHTTISVDGRGDARRCHFIPQVIGNIYRDDFESRLRARPCSNDTCGCHIGYVHLKRLQLSSIFGSGAGSGTLARVPTVPLSALSRFSLPRAP